MGMVLLFLDRSFVCWFWHFLQVQIGLIFLLLDRSGMSRVSPFQLDQSGMGLVLLLPESSSMGWFACSWQVSDGFQFTVFQEKYCRQILLFSDGSLIVLILPFFNKPGIGWLSLFQTGPGWGSIILLFFNRCGVGWVYLFSSGLEWGSFFLFLRGLLQADLAVFQQGQHGTRFHFSTGPVLADTAAFWQVWDRAHFPFFGGDRSGMGWLSRFQQDFGGTDPAVFFIGLVWANLAVFVQE